MQFSLKHNSVTFLFFFLLTFVPHIKLAVLYMCFDGSGYPQYQILILDDYFCLFVYLLS